jgi:peroxiredoxin
MEGVVKLWEIYRRSAMKTILRLLIGSIGIILLSHLALYAKEAISKTPVKGEVFPSIKLPMPKNMDEKRYLGLSEAGAFRVSQIKAKVVIIEIYSLYCPHCEAFAQEVNALYQMIELIPGLQDQIKMIGIAAGNSPLEVEAFREKHEVPFPLFPDEDFAIHKMLGEVRTPYFFVIKIKKDRTNEILYSEPGSFGIAENFLQIILKASGLR